MLPDEKVQTQLFNFFRDRKAWPEWEFFDLGGLFSQYFVFSECVDLPLDAKILTVGDYSCRDLQALTYLGFRPHSADLALMPGLDPSKHTFIQLDLNNPEMIR